MKNLYKIKDNIYITSSDEEIKEGDWQLSNNKYITKRTNSYHESDKKIILTTDQHLINDGVQEIDNNFLEWFVKNPSCDYIHVYNQTTVGYSYDEYHFVFPESGNKEETKQETLEEVAEEESEYLADWEDKEMYKRGFKEGAKWQQERMYSEEEVLNLLIDCKNRFGGSELQDYVSDDEVEEWFEKFKKK